MTAQVDTDEIRQIEAEAAPSRFARGWHCLGLTGDLGDGKPHAIHAFNQKLVVFRSGDGRINVLDGYCRHMGGDLVKARTADIMTRRPKTATPKMLASAALEMINAARITALFVVDKGKPVGIVHVHDLLRAGVA